METVQDLPINHSQLPGPCRILAPPPPPPPPRSFMSSDHLISRLSVSPFNPSMCMSNRRQRAEPSGECDGVIRPGPLPAGLG